MVNAADCRVETPYAAEPRGESHLAHGQSGLVDQLFGKLKPARLSHRTRRRPQMPKE